jgi:hypothetical protein
MSLIDSDPEVRRVLADLKRREPLPIARMVREAVSWLGKGSRPGNKAADIPDARQTLAAYRTKIVYHKVRILEERNKLAGIREDLRDHLAVKYVNFLAGVRNQRSREAMLAQALIPLRKRIREMNDALEVIDAILEDYDSRSFMFKDTISALQLGERE